MGDEEEIRTQQTLSSTSSTASFSTMDSSSSTNQSCSSLFSTSFFSSLRIASSLSQNSVDLETYDEVANKDQAKNE